MVPTVGCKEGIEVSTFTERGIKGTLLEEKMAHSRAWSRGNSKLVDENRLKAPGMGQRLQKDFGCHAGKSSYPFGDSKIPGVGEHILGIYVTAEKSLQVVF